MCHCRAQSSVPNACETTMSSTADSSLIIQERLAVAEARAAAAEARAAAVEAELTALKKAAERAEAHDATRSE